LYEPKISKSAIPNDFTAWNIAFTKMSQTYHYLSLNSSTLPTEIWLPATANAPIESATQLSIGWFKNFTKADLKFTAEIYYKSMVKLVAFVPGQPSLFNALMTGQNELFLMASAALLEESYLLKKILNI